MKFVLLLLTIYHLIFILGHSLLVLDGVYSYSYALLLLSNLSCIGYCPSERKEHGDITQESGDWIYSLCSKWRLCLQPMFKVEIVFTTYVKRGDCVYNLCSKWRLCLQPMFKVEIVFTTYVQRRYRIPLI